MPFCFKLYAEFLKIIEFAVEDEDILPVWGEHGLMPGGREVDDRQPAVTQTDEIICIKAFTVGTAMLDRVGHFSQYDR